MEAVNTLGDNVDETAVGGDGRVRRPRTRRLVGTVAALSAAATLALSGALVLGTPAEATAATTSTTATTTSTSTSTTSTATPDGATPDAATPAATTTTETDGTADTTAAAAATPAQRTATPAPTGTPAPLLGSLPPDAGGSGSPTPTPTDRPAVRPTIADPGDVTTATVRLHGTGTPGHTVRITGPGGTGCTATVGADGSWACMATVRSGPQQVFSVTDRDDTALGSSSAPASDVVVPPSVTTAGPTAGPLSGTGLPGATVTVGVVGARGEAVATVRADGTWTVALGSVAAQDGRLTVTASQTASTAGGYRSDLRSAASTPRTVTLDRTPPSAPRIETPRSGSTIDAAGTTIAGSGEPGATVTAYVDRAPVCRTRVGDDGRWRCSTEGSVLSGGTHAVTALQQDAAGNVSPSSPAIRVRASGSTTSPSTAPGTPSGTASNASPTGTPGRTAGATPGTTPTAGGGGAPGSAGSGPGGTTGGGAGSAGDPGSRGVPDWSGPAGDWAAATTYDRGVPSLAASFSWGTVLVATAVAAGFLVLVTTPLALVGAAARGRLRTAWLRNPFAGVLGRNRTRAERRLGDDVLPTWAAVALGVGIVTVATLLGVGVGLEARYVRLAVAVLAGSAVLTAAVVVATHWAAGRDRGTVGFRVSPWLVLAALVACALTRTTDVSPALVVGAVLVPVGRPGADTGALRLGSGLAAGVRSATARTGALLVVTAVGWVLHSVTPDTGFWAALGSEFATTLCVGGIGALVVSLVPVAGSAGATLLDAARGRYVGFAVASLALAAAVYVGSAIRPTGTGVVTAVATAAVAILVVGWWWQRRPGAAVGGDTAR